MNYINKISGAKISSSTYNSLTYAEKSNWVADTLNSSNRSSHIRRKSSSDGFIESTVIGAVTDSAIVGGLLGGNMLGGIVGDILDGDLMD